MDSVVSEDSVYSKNGTIQHTVTTGYGTDRRIASAGFMHGGAEKQFSYEYLPGSNLLQKHTLPGNMTLTQEYEPQRDLLIGMHYKRSSTSLVQRTYTYDTLGRPLTRSTARNNQTVTDSFGYNTRSELTSAIVNNGTWYTYGWDLTKNICEVFGPAGYIRTAYTYTPYGEVSATGDVTQPIQWSSEYNDTEFGLVYYNYRYYNPVDGRWIRRDDIDAAFNVFLAFENNPSMHWDILGHYTDSISLEVRKMLLQGYTPEEITKFLLRICAVKSASDADKLIKRQLQF